MAINKVIFGGNTLIDLTKDTVAPETLAAGETAHDASGEMITGRMPTTTVLYTEQNLTDAQKVQARENIGALEAEALPDAINTALAEAKKSGEFDGADGKNGKDGADGYTPQKGVDYNDGQPGKDGTSVTVTSVSESTADGGSNVVNFSDGKTMTVKNGKTGGKGADGKTPVKGVDYYNEADKAEFSAYIANELAKRGQLKPEFANSIEDCTDTTKLYVLPDGHIYAYMVTEIIEEGITYKNWLKYAVASDNTPYNGGQGWKTNTRLSSSGGESTSSATGMECTGFIPFKRGDVIRFSGITMNANSANVNRCYFIQYDSSKTMLKQWVVSVFNTPIKNGWALADADGNITQINTAEFADESNTEAAMPIYTNAAYFRISADEINADSIITINEEIAPSIIVTREEGWASTGHAFVPADYEDRIIVLENASVENAKDIINHEERIANLESGVVDDIPSYVVEEAESVIDRVISAQGSRTFTFATITDMHYGNGSYTDGVLHACQAMRYIDARIKLDAVSVLGDYTDGFTSTGYDNAIGDFKAINAELNGLRFAPNLRVHGNHDHYEVHSPILYRYISAYSDDVVWGSKMGGYFYRDFEDFKLRIVCLNTAEENDDGLSCSTSQYNWFTHALDLSGKEDVAEWQTLILSHHPLDWFPENGTGYVFWQILNAYLNGTSWSNSDGSITCNFAEKNGAKIVGNIHGHIHNLLTRNIAAGKPNATESTINVVRIATPEACYGRPNSYNGNWDYNPFGEETSYPKTKETAEDTSFCIYCIDLDTHTIKAICYGAGYDRVISY